jgi:hypothetical protein
MSTGQMPVVVKKPDSPEDWRRPIGMIMISMIRMIRMTRSAEAILKAYKISSPTKGGLNAIIVAAIVTICATIAIPKAHAFRGTWVRPAPLNATDRNRQIAATAIASGTGTVQTQADEDDDKDVPPGQVDKYVSVYRSMQKDHGLTVEQAASKQGMTVTQFRSLEDKIERDDTLRERVRTALRKAANPAAKESDTDQ